MLTLNSVNSVIQKETSAYVELAKGKDYFYFVYDDGKHYSTASVYVSILNQLSIEDWLAEAKDFYATVKCIRNSKQT